MFDERVPLVVCLMRSLHGPKSRYVQYPRAGVPPEFLGPSLLRLIAIPVRCTFVVMRKGDGVGESLGLMISIGLDN
jgi:hypothetical protein